MDVGSMWVERRGWGDWGEARRAFEDALERAVEAIDARHEALRRAMEVAKG